MAVDRSKQIEDFLDKLPDVTAHRPNKPVGLDEKIYQIVMDLNIFYEEQGREPRSVQDASFDERSLSTKLKRLRKDHHDNPLIDEIDIHGLVREGQAQEIIESPVDRASDTAPALEPYQTSPAERVASSLDNTSSADVVIPEDEDLETQPGDIDAFLDKLGGVDDGIFKLKHVASSADKTTQPDYVAQRVHCPNFHEYEPLFEKVSQELEQGIRESVPFRKEYEIEQGQFFILNGVMAYIAEMGEEYERNGKKNARMRVIFSNGTEGDNLKRSLATELYKDQNGRRISDPTTQGLFSNQSSEEDIGTGTIYVLKSRSDHARIEPIRNYLHKIGVTKGSVKQRIANADNQPTYLMAPVEVVVEFSIYNIKASKIEKLLHKYFDQARADITIEDRFGSTVRSTEWFFVLPQTVKEAVDLLISGDLGQTYYDPKQAKIRNLTDKEDWI
jgi:hypothetical protein